MTISTYIYLSNQTPKVLATMLHPHSTSYQSPSKTSKVYIITGNSNQWSNIISYNNKTRFNFACFTFVLESCVFTLVSAPYYYSRHMKNPQRDVFFFVNLINFILFHLQINALLLLGIIYFLVV
jgi:hypothetical protein